MENEQTSHPIIALLRNDPELTVKALAEILGITRQGVHYLLQKHDLRAAPAKYAQGSRRTGYEMLPKPQILIRPEDVAKLSPTACGTVAELVAAADLTARGWHVFAPIVRVASSCDLVAIARDGSKVLRIEVRPGRRNGDKITFLQKVDAAHDHYAIVIAGEPVSYKPALPDSGVPYARRGK